MTSVQPSQHCPYCGGTIHSDPMGGIVKRKCRHCGYVELSDDLSQEEMLSPRYNFIRKANGIASKLLNHLNDLNQINWQDQFFDSEKEDVSEFMQSPLYGMIYAAWLSKGFQRVKSEARSVLETVYHSAKEHTQDRELSVLKVLVNLYEATSTKRKRKLILISSAVGLIVVLSTIIGIVAIRSYSPTVSDKQSGISISIPEDAISSFDKLSVAVKAEEHPETSPKYLEAKALLSNVTEKFSLYDLSLTDGKHPLTFHGSVTVEIPIPEGFQTNVLRVYHVSSSYAFEEMPSTVSVANNTISFTTNHFSLFAVAERHPVLFFDTDGAGEIPRQIIPRGGTAAKPAAPQKVGYTFGGWMANGKAWNFETDILESDLTLKASWIPNVYTVTLVANGGNPAVNTLKIPFTTTYLGLPEAVTKPGYTFLGWYTAEEKGELVTPETVLSTPADHSLYARYEVNVNTVIFKPEGAQGTMKPLEMTTGSVARLPQITFTRNGYNFLGWSTSPTGEVEFTDQAEYSMGTESSYTLYAKWSEPLIYSIIFDSNDAGTFDTQTYTVLSSFNLPIPAKTHYMFSGWYDNPLLQGEPRFAINAGTYGNLSLYAKWTPHNYIIALEENGGYSMEDLLYNVETETFSLPTPVKLGSTFLGWYDNREFEGQPIVSIEKGTTGNQTYYAKWENVTFHIDYFANNGTLSENYTTEYIWNENLTVTLPTVTYSGVASAYQPYYKFEGWFENENMTIPFANDLRENPRNVTLYAKWNVIDETYIGVDRIPTRVDSDRVIIDLSLSESALCCKTINLESVSELILIGNTNASYIELTLQFHCDTVLVLKDFRMTGNIVGNGNNAKIVCQGNSSIQSIDASIAAISSFSNLEFSGEGTFIVDGSFGSSGSRGTNGNKNSKTGGTGGNGKVGGIGISATKIHFIEGTIIVSGGNGGWGGDGGTGNQGNGPFQKDGNGGNGGIGGDGGIAIQAESIIVETAARIEATGGDGGNGGNGGNGGSGGINESKGGTGGTGGNGGAGVSCNNIKDTNRNLHSASGAKGNPGTNGWGT